MTEHVVKCWSRYWDVIERGDKNFDVRRDDRGYQKGDTIVLQKFNPDEQRYICDNPGRAGKPLSLKRVITFVLTGGQFGIEPGYVVLALSSTDSKDAS